jgi:hypothetical protein
VTGASHRPPRSECAIHAATEVLGDPWSMLVLRDVIFGNRLGEGSHPTSSAAGSTGSLRHDPGWTARKGTSHDRSARIVAQQRGLSATG